MATFSTWLILALLTALTANTAALAEWGYCADGTDPSCTCVDGSTPSKHLGYYQGDSGVERGQPPGSSLCPVPCNPDHNSCDATTSPMCTYPNAGSPSPRAACACRPGYKASGRGGNATARHWRLPIPNQEHRVWVAEGVGCGTPCTIMKGAAACHEVPLLLESCVDLDETSQGPVGSTVPSTPTEGIEETAPVRRQVQIHDHEVRLVQRMAARANSPAGFDSDSVIAEWAADSGIDLGSLAIEDIGPPATDGQPPSSPSRGANSKREIWEEAAHKEGYRIYIETWQKLVGVLSQAATSVSIAQQPQLCSQMSRELVDGCKKGVRSQVAYCKQAIRDAVAQCKDNCRSEVDHCKKKSNIANKWKCEGKRPGCLAKCESQRIDVPFCEVDRLGEGCCEGFRGQALAMCASGVSQQEIQASLQKVQATCQVVTALAKAAIKSYLSGAVVGALSEIQSIKAIGETVQIYQRIQTTRANAEKWADGLVAASEGRLAEAKASLGSLADEIAPDVSNAVAWVDAAQAVVNRKVDGFVANMVAAAGELEIVKQAKDTIDKLVDVANDVHAIQSAAVDCARVPYSITPDAWPGWKDVSSWETLNSTVEAYRRHFGLVMFASARCQAVAQRTSRLIAAI